MSSPGADRSRPRLRRESDLAATVESATRQGVLAGAVVLRSVLRGVGQGLVALRTDANHSARRGGARREQLAAELEEARRLGRWHTAEDEALVREHEARLAAEQRSQQLRKAGRRVAVALLVVAWIVPVLWPLAIVGSFLVFPRTSRRVLLALVGLVVASLLVAALVVGQLLRGDPPPADSPLPPPAQERRER